MTALPEFKNEDVVLNLLGPRKYRLLHVPSGVWVDVSGDPEAPDAKQFDLHALQADVARFYATGLDSQPAKPAHDPVNHPSHYTSHPAKCSCGASIECIQITEHMGFNLGNAVKYLWRADLKGAASQDLSKAVWYIQREIDKRKKEGAQ